MKKTIQLIGSIIILLSSYVYSQCETNLLTVNMTDSYGDSWNGNVLMIGDFAFTLDGVNDDGAYASVEACIDDGLYIITCDGGSWQSEVSWEILDSEGIELLAGGAPFSGTLTLGETVGCMDENAINYNPDATIDDGSCVYGDAIIFEEHFDDPPTSESGWSIFDEDGGGTWEHVDGAEYFDYMIVYDNGILFTPNNDYLITPVIAEQTHGSNVLFNYRARCGGLNEQFNVLIYIVNTEEWITLETIIAEQYWRNYTVDLSTYCDQPFRLAIQYISDNESSFSVDDFVITSELEIPTQQASLVHYSEVTSSTMDISWTNGDGSQRAVFMYEGEGGSATPVENEVYSANTVFGNGDQIDESGWFCVYNGDGSSVSVSNLQDGTSYTFHVCEYNGNSDVIVYNVQETDGNPSSQMTTYLGAPIEQASSITIQNINYTTLDISWTNGDGSQRAVFMYEGEGGSATPVENEVYSANTVFGNGDQIDESGWFCVYNGDGSSVSVSNLQDGTSYTFHVCEYNGNSDVIVYNVQETDGNPSSQMTTYLGAPIEQASSITIQNINYTTLDISWTNGDGSQRAVFMYEGEGGSATPVENEVYSANTVFGNGDQIDESGWFCVYNGTSNSISITGLLDGSIYTIHVCEYNTDGGFIVYNIQESLLNPVTQTTLASVYYYDIEFYENVEPNTDNLENLINRGLPKRFKLKINNDLSSNILTGYSTISTDNQYVTITDNEATYNNVSAGSSAWSIDEFEIIVSEEMPPGSEIQFMLTVQQQLNPTGPWSSTFSFPVEPLLIHFSLLDDDGNPDSNGDNDGVIEQNETIEVIPLLENVSEYTLYSVEGTLTSDYSFINVWDNHSGASGTVYDTYYYNVQNNDPQPVYPGDSQVQPEVDFVFDYTADLPYELNMSLIVNGFLSHNSGNGIRIKYASNFILNEGQEQLSIIEGKYPSTFTLYPAFPNPFNPVTTLRYDLPEQAHVELVIYDIMGREVKWLVNQTQESGFKSIKWDATDSFGRQVSAGVYLAQIRSENYLQIKKLILLK